MRRLDWQLVRPDSEGSVLEPLQWVEIIRRLVHREARGLLTSEDREILAHTEEAYVSQTRSTCAVVGAPVVEDDPHWQPRMIDEFSESDAQIDLAEYLEMRRTEPDCERCPYTSPYSLFPMDPCEFAAGLLDEVLMDRTLLEQIRQPMTPDGMRALAEALAQARDAGQHGDAAGVDVPDYLSKSIYFLTFWADAGFGVLPVDIDDLINFGADGEATIIVDPEEAGEVGTLH